MHPTRRISPLVVVTFLAGSGCPESLPPAPGQLTIFPTSGKQGEETPVKLGGVFFVAILAVDFESPKNSTIRTFRARLDSTDLIGLRVEK